MTRKKRSRAGCLLAMGLAAALFLASCGSQNRLMFGTGGTAGTYYSFGGVLSQYMTNFAGVKVTAVSTGASKVNIESISDGDYQLGFAQSDVMTYAWNGTRLFESTGANRDFRVLGALYNETVQIITMDDKIQSVSDLKGKSVSIGAAGSGVYFNAVDVLKAADISLDEIHPQYQSFEDSKESLKDGKIDAAFIVAGAPVTAITELATTNGVKIVPINGTTRDRLLADNKFYAAQTLPAGTYPKQNDPIETVTIKATVLVSKNLDVNTVYKLTAAIFDHSQDIARENAKGRELSVSSATQGIDIPFHVGAAKYYAEHGVIVKSEE